MTKQTEEIREKIVNWIIKTLGGYTAYEYKEIQTKSYTWGYDTGLKKGQQRKLRSPGWLRSEIHKRLNELFPGKEYDHARYRWLRGHSMTTEHMAEMGIKELEIVNKELGKMLAEQRSQNE